MNDALLFLTQYGTVVLFAVVFVEQIGLPLPAIPVLIAAGALAGTGHMSLWTAIGVTVGAALAADWIWFELGRRRGRRVLGWLCRIALEPDSCVRKTEQFFVKHGPHSLVLAKFVPGLSTIAPPLAGIVGLGIPLFLLYDTLGAVVWAGSSIGLGYVFSDQIEQAVVYADQVTPVVMAAGIIALGGYVSFKAIHRRRQLRRVPRITAGELVQMLRTVDPPLLIDVRPHAAVAAAPGIPGALHLPLEELAARHRELPRHRELILYCGCPEDAASADGTLRLHKLGFTRVRPLAGGLDAWQAQQAAPLRTAHGVVENDGPIPRRIRLVW
ncbi:rhodanese-like domain-containing protein [Candidatus Nitrospira bockiana]